jgi:cardiolipin synthase (CMP-forming)
MKGTEPSAPGSSAILTIPNAISATRILLIPVFCALIVDRSTTRAGLILFVVVVATDWVDGWIARRTGSVSELGKILDPVADRLSIGAGLIALVVRGAFPLWAALLILVRDAAVLLGAAWLLTHSRIRVDVRFVGKIATFTLMLAIPCIAWGTHDYALAQASLAVGWLGFALGIFEYYWAGTVYISDVRMGLAARSAT